MLPSGDEHLEVEHHMGAQERVPATRLRAAMWVLWARRLYKTDGMIRLFHATRPFLYLPLPHLAGSRIRVLSSWCSSNSAMEEGQRPPQ